MKSVTQITIFITAVFTMSCSGSGGSGSGNSSLGIGSGTAGTAEMTALPVATSNIATSVSNSSIHPALATNGIPFATAATDEYNNSFDRFVNDDNRDTYFQDDGSYGACELHQKVGKGVYAQIAGADMFQCIAAQLEANASSTTNEFRNKTLSVTIGEEEMNFRLRYRVIRADNDEIKATELYGCENEDGSFSQTNYYAADFSGDSVSLILKSVGEVNNGEVDSVVMQTEIDATGVSNGFFTGTKTMDFRYQNQFSETAGNSTDNNHTVAQFTQTESALTYNGYDCNKATASSTTCDAGGGSQRLYANFEILDNNSEGEKFLGKYALGNGAAYMTLTNGENTVDGIQGWLGDTGDEANSHADTATFREAVLAAADDRLNPSATFEDVSFSAAETWNCSDAGDVVDSSLAQTILTTCVAQNNIDQDVRIRCGGENGGANYSTTVIAVE